MPDGADHLRQRLAPLHLSPEREAEIIEELSQHLDESYEELRSDTGQPASGQRERTNRAGEMGPRRQIPRLTPRPARTAA